MRILLCHDGSDMSAAAIPVARMIASGRDAHIEVVRVVELPPPPRPTPADVSTMTTFGGAPAADLHRIAEQRRSEQDRAAFEAGVQQAIGAARQDCEAILRDLPDGTTVHVEAITSSAVAEAIVAHARSRAADLIVMATHSRPALKEVFAGSVARRVVGSGVAPVVLVRPKG